MTTPETFVFATCTGRALSQRNVVRTLRRAQERATDEHGRPAFPALQERDVPANRVPSMHSFRHTVASRALPAGESVDEVAFLLGHRDATVTRVSTSMRSPTRAAARCAGHARPPSTPARSASPSMPTSRTDRGSALANLDRQPDQRLRSTQGQGVPRLGFQMASIRPGNRPNPQSRRPESNRGPLHYESRSSEAIPVLLAEGATNHGSASSARRPGAAVRSALRTPERGDVVWAVTTTGFEWKRSGRCLGVTRP
jgi:hypothetical protein